jgi:hypothetical protein
MSENKKTFPTMTVVFSIISLVVGLTIGIFYQKSKTPTFGNGQFQMGTAAGRNAGTGASGNAGQRNRAQGAGAAGAAGFRQTVGDIISADDKSITIKMSDGSSKIVLISDTTTINQSAAATKADLKVGAKVAVLGNQNTDGSITGKTINLNPSIPTGPSVSPAATK